MDKTAVVLISGGLDSATCLAIARHRGYRCFALSFDYGQRAGSEIDAARQLAAAGKVADHKIIRLGLDAFGGSALTDRSIAVPQQARSGIPPTYVPARNTVFLAYGLAWAEVLDADALFIGVNSLDYSGYPDCRPAFIDAFRNLMQLATKTGVEGGSIALETPLLHLGKAEIIKTGLGLGVDYRVTVSCYQADRHGRACGVCDSCRYRRQGFQQAAVADPTRYR